MKYKHTLGISRTINHVVSVYETVFETLLHLKLVDIQNI